MVSQAVASVDAWLVRAEEVLQAQQEHGISPSSVPWDNEREEWVLPLASFESALEDLLGRLRRRSPTPLLAGAGLRGRFPGDGDREQLLPRG